MCNGDVVVVVVVVGGVDVGGGIVGVGVNDVMDTKRLQTRQHTYTFKPNCISKEQENAEHGTHARIPGGVRRHTSLRAGFAARFFDLPD